MSTITVKIPRGVFLSQMSEWDHNIRIIMDKSPVKVSETKERLNVFDFLGFRPVLNDFDLFLIHADSPRTDNVSKVLPRVRMKLTFFIVGIQAMFPELL